MKNVFRQTINLSQEELADLLDISKSAVGMYESGRRRLTATVEIRLQLLKDFWALF
ncbi:helix-turn-helix domain-containing protein [Niabella hibiscisoli]|uniref:helix-turn-helix domain-containing protein n=1 Tax=Niabella hibiscisoli TaxID=1825928 RepID=UPI001F102C8E|nr:helix-turn-helix transcriptional regulator [Niabella hibiscisoli]MCH5721116.1 helix-turn-helix transcriptional regulator [Niabella hibiscisoli]